MTTRERMLAAYHNQKADRTALGIYSRYLLRGSAERAFRDCGLGIIEYHPVTTMLAPPWHNYSGYISEVKNVDLDIRYIWEQGHLYERRTYQTPIGEVYAEIGQSAGAGSEHIRKYYIKDIEDYKILQYIVENTVIKSNENGIQRKKHDLGEDGVVLGRLDRSPYQKLLIELAGAEQFLVDLYTDPDPVLELMHAMEVKMDEVFVMAAASSADVIWQPENVTSDMTPPDNFEKYCMPFYNKRCKILRQAGKPYVFHLDGKIKALKDHLNNTDFDVIESMSLPQIGGDYTFAEAVNAFPGKAIIPNFPSNLCCESDESIEKFLLNFKAESKDFPCMLQVSEDIPEDQTQRILTLLCSVYGDK